MTVCTSCGKDNPAGFAFCGHCGAALRDERPAAVEERKVVTVLFCDLVGFTADSEQRDPEDVRARIRPYHARLRQEIERYGGTVEKFVGDAVMAVFGAPVAHEDDAERAVRTGLRILEAIHELNETDPGLGLQVRVGINTGEAVVAVGARPERGEGIVTGDVVNTASRIESAAPVGAVAVGEQTYRTTRRVFAYEPLTKASVKGKAQPLSLWQAVAVQAPYGRDVRDRFRTPFVGRELEKPLLIGIFERATQQRSVQLVTVVGEPGVGKTRLIGELGTFVDADPRATRWRQGRCLPYGEGITFWALGEIVKAEAGILESDSAEVATDKLESAVPPDEPERRWLLQRLVPLVGVDAGSPAERQELFTAWRRYFETLAASRETVLVFDDLHWADAALLDFLEHLVEWSQGVALLVLCAARPELYERRPGWGAGLRNAHTINLSPLSSEETAELVLHLLPTTTLDPELERAVLERSGGNPLYAEEFARLLAERRFEGGEPVLPESVQALIAARLDTLTAERKSLLQDAAVFGKVFWAGAVAEIGELDLADVELALHELALKELVRPTRTSSMEGETEYSFWHLLVRDVAYAQIPRPERARRHRAAAAWIERKGGERVEDLAEVLAHHYVEALGLAGATGDTTTANELRPQALRFLALAGERALGLDTAQAEGRLAQALRLAPPGDPERPRLLVAWADALAQAGRPRDAADALDEALPVLRLGREVEVTAQALHTRSRVSQRLADGQSVALAAEAVERLTQEPPGPALLDGYSQLSSAQWLSGSYAEAVASADRALELAERLGLPEPARALGYRGMARGYLGEAGAIAEIERALTTLLESGAGRDAAIVQNNLGITRYPVEGVERSIATFESGIEFCRQRGLVEAERVLASSRSAILAEAGRPDGALAETAALAAEFEAAGQTTDLVEARAVQLAIRHARGEHPDLREVEELVENGRAVRHVDITPFALSCAAIVFATEAPARAREILVELEHAQALRETPYYTRQLPAIVRAAIAVGEQAVAEHLVSSHRRSYPLDEHALCAARAELSETRRELADAAELYADAAARWEQFGNVPERAHALLGRGRCLFAQGAAGFDEPLREARALFDALGYAPAAAEADALLEQAASAPAP